MDLTHISLITDNLAIAARDPRCWNGILEKVIHEISVTVGRTADLNFFDMATRLGEDEMDKATMETLKSGFNALLCKRGSENRAMAL